MFMEEGVCDPGMIMLKYRESKEEEGRKEGSQINLK